MRWLLFGVLLGVLLLYPTLLAQVIDLVAPLLSVPVVAFAVGLIVRPYLRRPRGWAR
jgi:hypothetical protein